jgi:hypothetical protein
LSQGSGPAAVAAAKNHPLFMVNPRLLLMDISDRHSSEYD